MHSKSPKQFAIAAKNTIRLSRSRR